MTTHEWSNWLHSCSFNSWIIRSLNLILFKKDAKREKRVPWGWLTRGAARSWTIIRRFRQGGARRRLNDRCGTTGSSCRLSTTIDTFLRTGTRQWSWCIAFRGYLLALKNRTVVRPFKQIWFPIVWYLKLGDDLLAETGSSYVNCHRSNALSCCRSNFKRVLDRLTRIRYFEDLLAQYGVYYCFCLDLMTANQHHIW